MLLGHLGGIDLLGPRRVWPALIGLALAAWSRQMTALYALPLVAMSFFGAANGPNVKRHRWIALVGLAVIAAVPLTLNTLKFGNPVETGYGRIYENRSDPIGRSGQEKLFGLRYVPTHLRAMNTAFPSWDIRGGTLYPDTSEVNGGSIWLTTPLLIAVLLTLPRWWRDRSRRLLSASRTWPGASRGVSGDTTSSPVETIATRGRARTVTSVTPAAASLWSSGRWRRAAARPGLSTSG